MSIVSRLAWVYTQCVQEWPCSHHSWKSCLWPIAPMVYPSPLFQLTHTWNYHAFLNLRLPFLRNNTLAAYLITPSMGSHFVMYLAKMQGQIYLNYNFYYYCTIQLNIFVIPTLLCFFQNIQNQNFHQRMSRGLAALFFFIFYLGWEFHNLVYQFWQFWALLYM